MQKLGSTYSHIAYLALAPSFS